MLNIRLVILISIVLCFLGCNKNDSKSSIQSERKLASGSIVLRYWWNDTDLVLHISEPKSVDSFNKVWNLKNGEKSFLMCGYTYDIYRIDSLRKAKWIGAANLECSTIVDDNYTYFNRRGLMDTVIKLTRNGVKRVDTLPNASAFSDFIEKIKTDSNFIGFDAGDQELTYEVVSPDRDFILSINKLPFSKFSNCSDSLSVKSACGYLNERDLKIIKENKIKFNATKIGIIVTSYFDT